MSLDGRAKNGVRNIVAGIFNKMILIILPFFLRTIMVNILGSQFLGLSSLFTSILTVLNLSELGFGSALVFSMYKPVEKNDKTKICALLNLYKKIYKTIGVVLLVAGLVLLPFIPMLINGECPNGVNIYALYLIYLINASISYFAFAHKKALLIAYQRSDIISNINTIVSILLYLLQIVILLIFENYYFYIILMPICTIVENLYIACFTKKKYPDIECVGNVSNDEKIEIKNHVKGIALQKICSTTRNSFDSIVISMYMGLTNIAIYNNYFYIISAIHSFLYQIPDAIRASVGNSIASEDLEKNYRDFRSMTVSYMLLNSFCSICLFCLFQPFMKIWMGKNMIFPTSTVALFCVYFYELGMSDIISLYKDGAGLWWHGRYRVLIEAILNLALNFGLGKIWGVNGILIATIVTLLFIGLGYGGYIVFHYYFTTQKYIQYIIMQGKLFLMTLIICIITYFTISFIFIDGMFGLLIKMIVCSIITGTLLLLFFSRTKEFIDTKNFLVGIIKRGSVNGFLQI